MEENEQSVVIQSDKKGFGIAGLILGVVSILCCMFLVSSVESFPS